MGFQRIVPYLSLSALAAFSLQACAPVSPSYSKSNGNNSTRTGGGASVLTTEEGEQIVLEDSRAVAIVVVGSKEADEAINNLPEAAGKPMELPIHETENLKKTGSYDHALRGLGNSKMSATAIIILDESSVAASGISAEQLKTVKFVWSIALDRKTIELGVSKKTSDSLKAAILPTIKNVVVAVAAIR